MQHNAPRTKEKRSIKTLHRLWMGAVVMGLIAMSILQAVSPSGTEQALAAENRSKQMVMYVLDSPSFALTDAHAAMADQVNFSFAVIQNGKANGDHWQGIRAMTAWLKKHPEVDGVLSVGGWGADGFSQACATEEGRQQLAESMLTLMDAYGFVGLDVDWEYPGSSVGGIASSPEDVDNWYSLLKLLRSGLDERSQATGRRHLLSVAVGAGTNEMNKIDGEALGSLADQVMLMTYDLTNFDKTTAHHAGLYPEGNRENSAAAAVQTMLKSGVPADRLLMGIPAYGRMWRQVSGSGNGLGMKAATSGNKTLTYTEAQGLLKDGYGAYYDEEAQAAWYYNGVNFVSAENERSLQAKGAYVLEHGLAGVGVWCWNYDADNALVNALRHSLTP